MVHLGPDNGGIVINVSVDGVFCQAAMRLGFPVGTQLNVRLRGSGLNVEALGEIVWIGPKHKEVGICFKNTPEKVRQEIAGWIDGQRMPRPTASFDETSPLRPMRPMPGVPAPRDNSAPLPFAASGMPRDKVEDPLESLGADEDDARLTELRDSEGGAGSVSPQPEASPPVQEIQDSGATIESSPGYKDLNLDVPRARALAWLRSPSAEQSVHVSRVELPPTEAPEEPATANLQVIEPARGPGPAQPPARARANDVAAAPQAAGAPPKPLELKAAPKLAALRAATRLLKALEALKALKAKDLERWIPPALLDAWKGGNPRHRLLIAGGAMLCVGFFALLLVLAASRTVGSGASPAGEASQPSTPPPALASVAPTSGAADASGVGPQPQIQQLRVQQRNVPRPAPPPQQPEGPPPSALEKFAKLLVGSEPENPDDAPPPPLPQIRPDQLGVPVWISKTSGYFYCTDDPYFKTINPGALTSQGDALQNGYRPVLNQFCD
jgi:hypothetical protein